MTFEAIGHVVHLLQDVSVPAHVRNDLTSHLAFQGFVSRDPRRWFSNGFEHYLKKNPDIVNQAQYNALDYTNWQVTDFWDTDGTTLTGMAEIINANYLSDSTIPNNNPSTEHTFTYPNISSENYQICEEESTLIPTVKFKYISRKSRGDCPPPEQKTTDHFAFVSFVNEEDEINNQNISSLKLLLDNNVHDTYAREIIPLAVSYSTDLINYFFRGEIEVIQVPNSNNIKIKNNSSEVMDGIFTLYYDAIDGKRYPVSDGSWSFESQSALGAGVTSDELTFTEPTDIAEDTVIIVQTSMWKRNKSLTGDVYESNADLHARWYAKPWSAWRDVFPDSAVGGYKGYWSGERNHYAGFEVKKGYELRGSGEKEYIIVFEGTLGSESNAVVGKKWSTTGGDELLVQIRHMSAGLSSYWSDSMTYLVSNPARFGTLEASIIGVWTTMFSLSQADQGFLEIGCMDAHDYTIMPDPLPTGAANQRGWAGYSQGNLNPEASIRIIQR